MTTEKLSDRLYAYFEPDKVVTTDEREQYEEYIADAKVLESERDTLKEQLANQIQITDDQNKSFDGMRIRAESAEAEVKKLKELLGINSSS